MGVCKYGETMSTQIIEQVETWLDSVVIGLNLCPFASKPRRLKQIHFDVYNGQDDKELLQSLYDAMVELDTLPAEKRETTLLIAPNLLQEFADYNQFLDDAQWVLERGGWEGIYQIASFHPHYQFAGTAQGDSENLTNCAPYPIFHLIREESLADILEKFPHAEDIPNTNILRMDALSEQEKRTLFPYLYH